MKIWFAATVLLVALPSGSWLQAADEMQPSTQWIGSLTSAAGQSWDARILVKERKGIDMACELWWDKDSRGLALAGTVSDNGTVVLKVTKEIKGTENKDLVDNGRLRATLSGKSLTGRWGVPGKNARFGEIKLKLKE